LSGRIRRLRDSTDAAVDPYGRITGTLVPSTAADEIGDLSRCYAVMIERLRQHHQYLETMAGRLSHELRTPLAVVRSSLDNLELNSSTEDPQLFVTRAKQGVERLSTIITQMSEASRLEQTLQNTEIVTLDIVKLVKDCMDAYRYTWPETAIEWRGDMEPILVRGAADLLVQMLDKLVSNAIDFSDARQPVILQVHRQGSYANILIQNSGQPIPREIEGRLFESMVSIRPKRSGKEPHLGLGLYIVRLITEFHGGRVSARNLPKEICVEFSVQLPAKK
ncbi:MAG: proteobacterial dedicated sortase system histidine kinase, partial [Gammaproteobacteria bacterium]|nr:proteobacterial dedicated sortase system histidine kinase [Gammaproteobacteria bacterium]